MLRRTLSTLLVASAALVAVGCAGTAEPRGAVPQSASLAPADALAYATVTTDESSGQWQAAHRLIDRIPGAREDITTELADALAKEGLSWKDDVAPAIGPEVVVVGISADSLSTHQRFARSLDMPFMLLSDPDQKVSDRYGSAASGGLNRRTVYVIRPDGKVAYRNMDFVPVDPKAYQLLKRAVAEASR